MAVRRFNLLVIGTVPDGPNGEADEGRERLVEAVEKAVQALDRKGVYLDAMTYQSEAVAGRLVAQLTPSSEPLAPDSSGLPISAPPASLPASTFGSQESSSGSSPVQEC